MCTNEIISVKVGVAGYTLEHTEEMKKIHLTVEPCSHTAKLWKSDMHKLNTIGKPKSETSRTLTSGTQTRPWEMPVLLLVCPWTLVTGNGEGTGWACEPLNSPWWGLNMDKKNMNCKTEMCKSTFQWYKIVNNTTKFLQFFLFSVRWNRWLSFCIKTARDQTEAVRHRH